MERENIKMLFCRIIGISSEKFEYADLIERAAAMLGEKLVREPLDESETAKCEYAAAAQAVYEYTQEKALSDRIVLTENGAAIERSQQSVNSARQFRNAAFAALKDMIHDDDFLFMLC